MNTHPQFRQILDQTRVVRFPRHRLATFGMSEIQYNLVTSVSEFPPQSTLRLGRVTAERPRILTPESFSRIFEGFGEDAGRFERWLKDHFQDAFRGLHYTFRNHLTETSPHQTDFRVLAENIRRDLDERDVTRAAVICGPEQGWQFALMKFILEETSHSFPVNARELEERGLFDPDGARRNRQRNEIETLFQQAQRDPELVQVLGRKLKEYDVFAEYQDRFFSLMKGA